MLVLIYFKIELPSTHVHIVFQILTEDILAMRPSHILYCLSTLSAPYYSIECQCACCESDHILVFQDGDTEILTYYNIDVIY